MVLEMKISAVLAPVRGSNTRWLYISWSDLKVPDMTVRLSRLEAWGGSRKRKAGVVGALLCPNIGHLSDSYGQANHPLCLLPFGERSHVIWHRLLGHWEVLEPLMASLEVNIFRHTNAPVGVAIVTLWRGHKDSNRFISHFLYRECQIVLSWRHIASGKERGYCLTCQEIGNLLKSRKRLIAYNFSPKCTFRSVYSSRLFCFNIY